MTISYEEKKSLVHTEAWDKATKEYGDDYVYLYLVSKAATKAVIAFCDEYPSHKYRNKRWNTDSIPGKIND